MKPPNNTAFTGKRILGLHIQAARDNDYPKAFALAKSIGVGVVPLPLDWSRIETAPRRYDSTLLTIANQFYPAQKMPLHLILRPINTVKREVPADLAGVAWDDPKMIERFEALLDNVLTAMKDVQLETIVIGNEVAPILQAEPKGWQTYAKFLAQMRDKVRATRPHTPVGVTIALKDLLDSRTRTAARELNAICDAVCITYYPLNADFTVQSPDAPLADFAAVTKLYPDRPIHFIEAGFPSGAACKSSEVLQARFVESIFTAWDQHAKPVRSVSFSLGDRSLPTRNRRSHSLLWRIQHRLCRVPRYARSAYQ